MRLGQLPLVLLIAAAAGCGGVDETGMSIAISRSGLSEGAVKAWVRVHVKDRTCEDVRTSGHDKRASYRGDFNFGGSASEGTVHEIRPGTYTVAVWIFNADMAPLDFGCRENISIKDGEKTEVSIVVEPI